MFRWERITVIQIDRERNNQISLASTTCKGGIVSGPAPADGASPTVGVVALRRVHDKKIVYDDSVRWTGPRLSPARECCGELFDRKKVSRRYPTVSCYHGEN